MPVAAVMDNDTEHGRTASTTARLARVDIFSDMAEAEATWRTMERTGSLLTPFQRFDFLSAWQTHVGRLEGVTPFIVVACDSAARPLLLLPLGVRRESGVRVASFLGGKHATFNMPLLAPDFAATAGQADLMRLRDLLRDERKADLLALTRQPARWLDVANPLAALPSQPSVNNCPLLTLTPGAQPADRISNSFRRRLKGKERKLQGLAGYRYLIARSDDEIRRVIDAFFTMKPQRMAIQKLPNVFAEPGIAAFIDDACHARWGDGRTIEIHALECDEEVIAIFAGMADGHRFSMMFNTYTISPNAKYSPGLILLRNIIDHYADLDYTAIDLGIGSDDYKLLFCKDDEPIFDSFLPLSARGSAAGMALSAMTRAKRAVKQTPALAQLAQRVRGVLQR
ncbi:GNAT family N-acetyltransferase [Bradyrhizobium sp. U87765 SZCCT0131]|uniref:GNAT family N-acetyltransferase n=1 Tax=unclassified Bradyrhizobium TaxID=2631580 RepID=UPI001BACF370|nr:MULTISPECIES: GNAT family N-acetyltransferase [unclassified Bradyrhizobium]MBR1219971.1 GNAT family N-acetyltransferase [Bradyrhizobium sp. U87765 SZCCT0131]MBR1263573.1 GNAT family N-acetyltransferase [Bradyrhizobium sp. U87765 SZCCT0134]MBR1309142.1 GNAT family N-acetyltransferase [Bradyrhizobium sp. U87765 SZCCT0110]MBR1323905.1 GNAT family N-acetyltransferase [Bradyrhizobium sp. U87765 SZCCT0109]MBR1349457.1 GNAT family N-acetyltransferase [Bradyrhizobium sp. U87765 SZCCT0048]